MFQEIFPRMNNQLETTIMYNNKLVTMREKTVDMINDTISLLQNQTPIKSTKSLRMASKPVKNNG